MVYTSTGFTAIKDNYIELKNEIIYWTVHLLCVCWTHRSRGSTWAQCLAVADSCSSPGVGVFTRVNCGHSGKGTLFA